MGMRGSQSQDSVIFENGQFVSYMDSNESRSKFLGKVKPPSPIEGGLQFLKE